MDKDFEADILPTLTVSNALAAIDFYVRAFGAGVLNSNTSDGHTVTIMFVEGTQFIVADESPAQGNIAPERLQGISIRIGLMVGDPDALAGEAVKAGITTIYPVADRPYGYRLGHFIDPFGHHWEIGRPLK